MRTLFACMFSIVVVIFTVGFLKSETVDVAYSKPVDLRHLTCFYPKRSKRIERVCYDIENKYLLVRQHDVYYAYCEVGEVIVEAFTRANSMFRFLNNWIEGGAWDGPYDCRTHRKPYYVGRSLTAPE